MSESGGGLRRKQGPGTGLARVEVRGQSRPCAAVAAGLWAGAAAEPGVQLGPLLPHPWGSLPDVGHEDGVAKADGLAVRAQRDFPSPTLTFLRPSVSCSPRPRSGVEGRKRGRRAQAAGAGKEGQVPACRGRMAAETGSKPQEPGMDSFPPALSPSPLIFTRHVPTSHHTHLEATPSIFSLRPPLPPFLPILGPEGCRSAKAKGGGRRWG